MTTQTVLFADPLNVFAQTPFMRLLGMQRDYSSGGKAQMSLQPNADLGNGIGALTETSRLWTCISHSWASPAARWQPPLRWWAVSRP